MKIEIFDRPTYLLLLQSTVHLRNALKNDHNPAGSKQEYQSSKSKYKMKESCRFYANDKSESIAGNNTPNQDRKYISNFPTPYIK